MRPADHCGDSMWAPQVSDIGHTRQAIMLWDNDIILEMYLTKSFLTKQMNKFTATEFFIIILKTCYKTWKWDLPFCDHTLTLGQDPWMCQQSQNTRLQMWKHQYLTAFGKLVCCGRSACFHFSHFVLNFWHVPLRYFSKIYTCTTMCRTYV